jgi:hypothetical protein
MVPRPRFAVPRRHRPSRLCGGIQRNGEQPYHILWDSDWASVWLPHGRAVLWRGPKPPASRVWRFSLSETWNEGADMACCRSSMHAVLPCGWGPGAHALCAPVVDQVAAGPEGESQKGRSCRRLRNASLVFTGESLIVGSVSPRLLTSRRLVFPDARPLWRFRAT